MRKFYFGILALAALAACSKEEQIATSQGEEITFSTFVGKATRADDATDPSYNANPSALIAFKLWGTVTASSGDPVAIYEDNSVTGSGIGDNWTCSKKNYWIPTAKYNFAAIANADTDDNGKSVVTLGADDLLPETVTFTAVDSDSDGFADGTTDLIYARPDEITAGETNDKVAFTFDHLLSKVKFTVNNSSTDATGYSYQVNGITIHGASKGTCTVADKSWEVKENGNTSLGDIEVAHNVEKQVCVSEKLVIPTTVNVSFALVRLVNGSPISTKYYKTDVCELKAGHAYNFAISVSAGNEIQFSVAAINTWDKDTDPNTDGVQEVVTLNYTEI